MAIASWSIIAALVRLPASLSRASPLAYGPATRPVAGVLLLLARAPVLAHWPRVLRLRAGLQRALPRRPSTAEVPAAVGGRRILLAAGLAVIMGSAAPAAFMEAGCTWRRWVAVMAAVGMAAVDMAAVGMVAVTDADYSS